MATNAGLGCAGIYGGICLGTYIGSIFPGAGTIVRGIIGSITADIATGIGTTLETHYL
jgi:hypothetical protein